MIDETMDDGYTVALAPGAVYQGGSWNSGGGSIQMAVFKSTNSGTTWDRKAMGTAQGGVKAIAVFPADPNLVFAGGYYYDASYYSYSRLYKSTDAGATWTENNPATFNQQFDEIRSIQFDPFTSSVIVACTYRSVYVSTNSGASWSKSSASTYNHSLLADPGVKDCYYLGTDTGVRRSTDGGMTWSPYSSGLTSSRVACLTIDPVNRKLYAGTDGGGVYRLDVVITDIDGRDDEQLPAAMSLGQNYPNPFNPTTTIEYRIPGAGTQGSTVNDARLVVYDPLGREVAVLVDEKKSPGTYRVRFDARGLPSGVYIYRLIAGQASQSRKMVLVR